MQTGNVFTIICGTIRKFISWYVLLILAALSSNNTLLCLTLSAMQGYQRLSPHILSQVNLNVSKLLPPLHRATGSHDPSHDSSVVLSTLELLLHTSNDALKLVH